MHGHHIAGLVAKMDRRVHPCTKAAERLAFLLSCDTRMGLEWISGTLHDFPESLTSLTCLGTKLIFHCLPMAFNHRSFVKKMLYIAIVLMMSLHSIVPILCPMRGAQNLFTSSFTTLLTSGSSPAGSPSLLATWSTAVIDVVSLALYVIQYSEKKLYLSRLGYLL
jgi:hypothetical protein